MKHQRNHEMAAKQTLLLSQIMRHNKIKNYAALSRVIGVSTPALSKYVNGDLPIGDSMILRLHETFGVPVASIRAALV